GEEKREYSTAATSQKCVRAGGKHNDLENVGYTARHHTFFEMLGNFSFGDYFKEKAIDFSWDLLVNGYGLLVDKLWISIFHDDDEAFELWNNRIGVPSEKIVRLGEKDNFWAMGDTGPCGPCSEIHFDRGEAFGCDRPDCRVGCDCDRYLEIWNLVFMQFNKDKSGKMSPLPKPSIDTGLGLERIISILQDTPTNYETDLFRPLIKTVEDLSEKRLGESNESDVAMKVIADHSRATAFLIGDGVLPSNEGRGYVLRRIMRRAIRYGRYIGLTRPFLHRTTESVFHVMEDTYPELKESGAFITNVVENEEKRFIETLDNGLKLLEDTLSDIQSRGESTIPGDVIFKLYDTFGFPVDIVRDIVRDKNMSLDMDTFNREMDEQKARSKSVVSFSEISDAYKNLSVKGVKTEFSGYNDLGLKSEVLLIVKDNIEADEAGKGKTIEIVTKATPFYAESGGQVGDTGRITGDDFEMIVTGTLKDPTGLIIHKGRVVAGSVKNGETVLLSVEDKKRKKIALNHTATHLLHAALRSELGDHVKQAGSLVSPDRLRFDFSHFSSIDRQDLDKIEKVVNDRIRQNIKVIAEEMDADDAIKTGATALFDEKYGDRVRVISINDFSMELCGGTHTDRTGDIGLLKILSENGIAAGVRRIEAITGAAAVEYAQKIAGILDNAATHFK
ncbi:MAG: alanine--tRNA ligase, partial [Deltaproteobacteria bacterium]|nr:alanine--tRNA ligase [Deltaproteobacteria bacterium]